MLEPFSEPGLTIDQEPRGDLPIHLRAADLHARFTEIGLPWGAYFKFTTVRNPWAKLVSLFAYEKAMHRLATNIPFHRWLVDPEGVVAPEYRMLRGDCYTLAFFACDAGGAELVDAVVPVERFNAELPGLLARLGIPAAMTIPRINVTEHDRYTSYYDSSTRRFVELKYGAEIERFGYRFGA